MSLQTPKFLYNNAQCKTRPNAPIASSKQTNTKAASAIIIAQLLSASSAYFLSIASAMYSILHIQLRLIFRLETKKSLRIFLRSPTLNAAKNVISLGMRTRLNPTAKKHCRRIKIQTRNLQGFNRYAFRNSKKFVYRMAKKLIYNI